ncbi:mechanosensitive ion channel family protein [Tenacibaculum ovolyticum]|uniref:mechanosensitive ion channel family protein n=1 Tax=Tenacibaculum ovolyticum TaxID=104270 RepID=UPI001F37E88E|nr:mechanosensitive ion channel family protein [Tenacibaculum ovolyticum]
MITSNVWLALLFFAIIIVTILVSFLVNRFFKHQIKKSTEDLNNDPTNYHFLRHLINVLIYIVGFSFAIYTVPQLRLIATSLLAGAGVLAIAVGFASQQALSNIISGVFIIIFKPFRINDRLKIGDKFGIVEDITLRHTVIKDFENKRIIIPNSIISNEIVVNSDFIDDIICKWIEVGISYDSDIKLAKKIIREEVLNHPLHIDARTDKQKEEEGEIVPVRVIQLAEFSINIRAWAWAEDSANAFIMSCDLNESIKLRFDNEGIEIPFPYRTIVYKNDISNNTNSLNE